MHDESNQLIDIRNKLETVEDKIDRSNRMLIAIARHLTDDKADANKAAKLTADLAKASSDLEAVVAASKPT